MLAIAAVVALTAGCIGPSKTSTSDGTTLTSVPGLPDDALEVMNQPQFASGRWAISVKDLDTGETLIDLDADTLAEPGSFV